MDAPAFAPSLPAGPSVGASSRALCPAPRRRTRYASLAMAAAPSTPPPSTPPTQSSSSSSAQNVSATDASSNEVPASEAAEGVGTHIPTVEGLVHIRRALISVSDKTCLVGLAKELSQRNVYILSTGGTATMLRGAEIPVADVAEYTEFPEMMDGRVKTLHPRIHGALLAKRDDEAHVAAMNETGIVPIDLVIVNLYPFEETVAQGKPFDMCVENIDVGGPSMVRAASKNFRDVVTVTDPRQYPELLAELAEHDGATTLQLRKRFAAAAYARIAAYDAAVAARFSEELGIQFAERIMFPANIKQTLRYGENPHQLAAFYTLSSLSGKSPRPGVSIAEQVQGKELSYNNISDTDAAFELVSEFPAADGPVCAIIKHANPCGVAAGVSAQDAFLRALACDPTSAFGGIVALNVALDKSVAEEITQIFTEVVIAPDATADALEILSSKKNVRVLLTGRMPDPDESGMTFKSVSGGMLVQTRDCGTCASSDVRVVTKREPSEKEMKDLLFAWKVCKHVKSNAIVYAKDLAAVGTGAGQMSRVDSARIAVRKANDASSAAEEDVSRTVGSVMASDAFFPFADGLVTAADAGVTAVIQPGGSKRDEEVIAAAEERGIAMVLTGVRHFRH